MDIGRDPRMPMHLKREIEALKRRLLGLCALLEEAVRQAVRSVENRDGELARRVIEGDTAIDRVEVEVEEECLKILALHQPVAGDLRFIVICLKINNDLERMGDLAVNIAERAEFLASEPPVNVPFDFPTMAEKAQAMVKNSLDALVNLDAALAREVCKADDEVDAINREMYGQIKKAIREQPECLDQLIHLLGIARHLERIADLATNIAEDIIYMVEGEIVRHYAENYGAGAKKD